MIVQMQVGIGKDHEFTSGVVEKANRFGLRPKVEVSRGKTCSVTEVRLFDGKTTNPGVVPEFIFSHLPGVSEVRRVTPCAVSLIANGDRKTIRLGSLAIGSGQPCQLIAGPCTVSKITPKLVELLAKAGIKFIRGGCFKPRSRPGSYIGPREQGLELLFRSAKENGIEAVFTEVMDTFHVQLVDDTVAKTGYQGKVVLWIGARTMNQELLIQLGKQRVHPVMVKNGLDDQSVEEWMNRVGWLVVGEQRWGLDGKIITEQSLRQGNDQIMLCVRGLRNPDHHSQLRGFPNLHWISEIKERYWAPVGVDTNHFTGTMENDLVLRYLRFAMEEEPDFVLLEVKIDDDIPLCDAEQAVPVSRIPEVLSIIEEHAPKR